MKFLIYVISVSLYCAPPTKLIKLAEKGYDHAVQKHLAGNPMIVIVDFSMPSNKKRLWLYDIKKHKTILETYVAHGKGSGMTLAKKFSDKASSRMSSIGFFQIQNTYNGRHGLSVKLDGLEKFNKSALKRGIVIHSANYVEDNFIANNNRAGRSWGCFAVSKQAEKLIIAKTKNHSLLLAYYPDIKWQNQSKFIH